MFLLSGIGLVDLDRCIVSSLTAGGAGEAEVDLNCRSRFAWRGVSDLGGDIVGADSVGESFHRFGVLLEYSALPPRKDFGVDGVEGTESDSTVFPGKAPFKGLSDLTLILASYRPNAVLCDLEVRADFGNARSSELGDSNKVLADLNASGLTSRWLTGLGFIGSGSLMNSWAI